mmetsp:Transcript_29945/g.64658  ORF Transcript_29945/g.64658 Transcript_29945/m.64658 type:complete len:98 (-) Transcript_29945:51-344(-)
MAQVQESTEAAGACAEGRQSSCKKDEPDVIDWTQLTPEEIRTAVANLGENLTDEEIDEMIREAQIEPERYPYEYCSFRPMMMTMDSPEPEALTKPAR